ncbi:kinase [Blastocystis sp. subtype 4]|uniref:kinase n=1 Tax=Blastocystis sp. subtype 4 TaxID=944170 RepID=UPI000711BA99|nr:kinase [Blastocystis sp. subtype 4]KNB46108.1 kinase [Blastocystis sp. subtype 4]|eukprot:XP_014529551.1 kinase [Blastocystis sp. subtype 4]
MFCQYNDFQSLLLMLLKTRPLITCDVTGFRHIPLGARPPSVDTSSASETVETDVSLIGSCRGGVDSPGRHGSKGPSVQNPVKTTESETNPAPSHGPIHLEDFEVQAVLGRGGYGKVLHVYNAKTHCYYAMKVLKKDELVRRRQVSRTKVERLILERADFPFITRLYYAYQTPYRLYMIMDFMQCGDLFTHLSRFGVFSEERTRLYMAEIVLALEHLHNMGIIFRDLKPENVLLGADGHIKLTDFGLSRYYNINLDEKRHISEMRSYSYCGTEQYMAPEMLLRRPHTEAIDWWALGILMCECLTGYHPFQGHSHHQTLNNIMNNMVPPRIRGVSMDARSLILRLLERDPAKRLGSDEAGVAGIKTHPFFASLDWNAVLRREVRVPMIPQLNGPLDYTYFDRSLVRPVLADSVCSPQRPLSEMELQLRIRQEKERQQTENPRNHARTRTPSLELDTRYIGFEYSCDS